MSDRKHLSMILPAMSLRRMVPGVNGTTEQDWKLKIEDCRLKIGILIIADQNLWIEDGRLVAKWGGVGWGGCFSTILPAMSLRRMVPGVGGTTEQDQILKIGGWRSERGLWVEDGRLVERWAKVEWVLEHDLAGDRRAGRNEDRGHETRTPSHPNTHPHTFPAHREAHQLIPEPSTQKKLYPTAVSTPGPGPPLLLISRLTCSMMSRNTWAGGSGFRVQG